MAMKFSMFETGQDRYQPDPSYAVSDNNQGYRLDQRRQALLVGLIALCLPLAMLIGVVFFETCLYDSISHFYYAQFLGGVFIAALAFIGTFLIAYRGESASESRLATIAGWGAMCVALFPTSGRGCENESFSGRALADFVLKENGDQLSFVKIITETDVDPLFFELFSGAELLHGGGATLLFAFLAWYSFYVFTRVIDEVHGPEGNLTPQKRSRNRFYRACGIVIVVSMLAIIIGLIFKIERWGNNNLTFWFESLALWAFGISWMVKGRFFDTVWLDEREKNDSR